jgi:transcriptional regulator with XRE-family HTH domain
MGRNIVTVYCRNFGRLSGWRQRVSFLSMTSDAPALGRIVRSQRERLHLTQAELAEQVGVSRSAISELEAGRISQPRATVFARLAKSLGLPAAALLAAAGYPEAEIMLEIETDEIALLAASLANLAGKEREWLRSRLLELRDLLLLRRDEEKTVSAARTRGAARARRARHR